MDLVERYLKFLIFISYPFLAWTRVYNFNCKSTSNYLDCVINGCVLTNLPCSSTHVIYTRYAELDIGELGCEVDNQKRMNIDITSVLHDNCKGTAICNVTDYVGDLKRLVREKEGLSSAMVENFRYSLIDFQFFCIDKLYKRISSKNYSLTQGIHLLPLDNLETLLHIPKGIWKLTFFLPKLTGSQIVVTEGEAVKLNTSKKFEPTYLFTGGSYKIFREKCPEVFVSLTFHGKEPVSVTDRYDRHTKETQAETKAKGYLVIIIIVALVILIVISGISFIIYRKFCMKSSDNKTVTLKLEYPEEEPIYHSVLETGSEYSVRNPPAGSSHNESLDKELDYRFTRNNNNNNGFAPVIKAYRKSRSVSNLLNQCESSSRVLKATPSPNLRFKRRSNSASNVLEMDLSTTGSVHHIPLNNGKFLSISIHDNSVTPLLYNGERQEYGPDLPEDNYSGISDLSNVTSVSQMANKSLQPQLSIVRETPKETQHELEV